MLFLSLSPLWLVRGAGHAEGEEAHALLQVGQGTAQALRRPPLQGCVRTDRICACVDPVEPAHLRVRSVLPRHGDRRAVFEAYVKNILNEERAAKRARV